MIYYLNSLIEQLEMCLAFLGEMLRLHLEKALSEARSHGWDLIWNNPRGNCSGGIGRKSTLTSAGHSQARVTIAGKATGQQ